MTVPTTTVPRWATPTGVKVLPWDAPRDQWLAARREGVGGSDIAGLLGASEYDNSTPWFVWASKLGMYDVDQSAAMARGTALEDLVVGMSATRLEVQTRRCGMLRHNTHNRLLASPDRLTSDGGGLEVKTTTSWGAKQWPADGSCPPSWAWQARHCALVSGRSHWWVTALVIDEWRLAHWLIVRDPGAEGLIVQAVSDLWEHVETGVAPPVDPTVVTSLELARRYPEVEQHTMVAADEDRVIALVSLRTALKRADKEHAAELRSVEDELRVIAGSSTVVTTESGTELFSWKWQNSASRQTDEQKVAWGEALETAGLDAAAYRTASRHRVLRTK